MSTKCPTCERDDFASRQGMKVHHSASHGEKLPRGEPRVCGNCGDTVYRFDSEVDNASSGEVFCDSECQYEWMEDRFSGDSNPTWNSIERDCPVCGDTFFTPPSKMGEVVTCSTECKSSRMEEVWDEINPNFASFVGLTGDDNPSWDGGYEGYSYGEGWSVGRRRAKRRDGHECVICGSDGPVLDAHHIIPFGEFDDPADANVVENLVTLCRGCHMDVDGRGSA